MIRATVLAGGAVLGRRGFGARPVRIGFGA
jgi:hypothetical protein